jgi:hypothetical protein
MALVVRMSPSSSCRQNTTRTISVDDRTSRFRISRHSQVSAEDRFIARHDKQMPFCRDTTVLIIKTFHRHVEVHKGCAMAVLEIASAVGAACRFHCGRHGVVLRHGCIRALLNQR